MEGLANQSLELIEHCTVANNIDIYSQMAIARLLQEDLDGARKFILNSVGLLHRPNQIALYPPCASLSFVCLKVHRRCPRDQGIEKAVRQTVAFVKQFSGVFPVGEAG